MGSVLLSFGSVQYKLDGEFKARFKHTLSLFVGYVENKVLKLLRLFRVYLVKLFKQFLYVLIGLGRHYGQVARFICLEYFIDDLYFTYISF